MDSSTRRRIFKAVGYPLFFLAAFATFLVWSFPIGRFSSAAEAKLSELLGREVKIGDLSLSLTGDVVLNDVEIEVPVEDGPLTGGTGKYAVGDDAEDDEGDDEGGEAGAKPKRPPRLSYLIDEIAIDVGLLGLLFDELVVDVELEALGGELEISYAGPLPGSGPETPRAGPRPVRPGRRVRPGQRVPPGEPGAAPETAQAEEAAGQDSADAEPLSLAVRAEGIELRMLHDLRRKLPLPVTGELSFEIDLSSETGRFADASGRVTVGLRQLVLGNSKSQLDLGGMPMTIDEIAIASLDLALEVKEGKGTFEEATVKSNDFDAKVKGSIKLVDPVSRSRLDLYLTFKFLDGYIGKSERAKMLVSSLDDFSRELKRAHRKDGYYGFRYRGAIGSASFTPAKKFKTRKERQERKERKTTRRDRKGRTPGRSAAGGSVLPGGPALGPTPERIAPGPDNGPRGPDLSGMPDAPGAGPRGATAGGKALPRGGVRPPPNGPPPEEEGEEEEGEEEGDEEGEEEGSGEEEGEEEGAGEEEGEEEGSGEEEGAEEGAGDEEPAGESGEEE